jgi:hypothetical protein
MPKRSEASWLELTHLVAAFEACQAGFRRSADADARAQAEALESGLAPAQAALDAGPGGVWPAGLLAGMREGARELPMLLTGLPRNERRAVAIEVERAGGRWLTELLFGAKTRIPKILARGRLRDEDEYRMVRAYVDTIEGDDPAPPELAQLWMLLDSFTGSNSD